MENKYEVIGVERINAITKLVTLIDLKTHDDYSCILEKEDNKLRVLADDMANIFDVGEALFQYDLDILPLLPQNMITPDMYREYQDYYPGKGKCNFDKEEEFKIAYETEEKRIKKLKKQLVK